MCEKATSAAEQQTPQKLRLKLIEFPVKRLADKLLGVDWFATGPTQARSFYRRISKKLRLIPHFPIFMCFGVVPGS